MGNKQKNKKEGNLNFFNKISEIGKMILNELEMFFFFQRKVIIMDIDLIQRFCVKVNLGVVLFSFFFVQFRNFGMGDQGFGM